MCLIVINLMPDLKTYENELNRAITSSGYDSTNIKWAKLKTKKYRDKPGETLPEYYVDIDELLSSGEEIHSVLITGAPLEHLEFEAVYYWAELKNVISFCINYGIKILGICWGALALANVLGIRKVNLPRKIFGVYSQSLMDFGDINYFDDTKYLICPFSISASFNSSCVDKAVSEKRIKIEAICDELGPSLISAQNGNVLMSLGHFEYGPKRLREEWLRDSHNGTRAALEPENYCLEKCTPCCKEHTNAFFGNWLHQ